MAMPSGGKQKHCTDLGEEGDPEVCEQIQGHISADGQYGRGPERPARAVFLPRRGQDICLPSSRNVTRYTAEPAVRENEEGLQSRRH